MPWLRPVREAWNLLMPVECAGCGDDGRSVCARCRATLASTPTPRTIAGMSVVTTLRYEGEVRRMVIAFKEGGRSDVATALAPALRAAVVSALDRSAPTELVVVPGSRAAYRRRGYHPVELLLRRAGIRYLRALRHTRRVDSQKALGADDRFRNLEGAFAATRDLTGRRLLVVDDVVTTGATIAEAIRALEAAGGRVVGGVTLAFTPRIRSASDNR